MGELKSALERACHPMLAWLDPAYDHHPTLGYEVAHDVGRWWDAALRLEQAIGWAIPSDIEAAMLRNFQRLTDNTDALLVNESRFPNGKRVINPHNLRETMLAYHALVQFRSDDWARDAGRCFLKAVDRCVSDDGHFRAESLGIWGSAPLSEDRFIAEREDEFGWYDATTTTGRCLEPVVLFHKETGDELALRLAERLAENHLRLMFDDDRRPCGKFFEPQHVGHNHSYLGTVRGLLLFGLHTGQRRYVEAVNRLYRESIWQHNIEDDSWTPHDLGSARCVNAQGEKVGEPASAADVAQIALWLAEHGDQRDLLADIDKIVYSHLLPTQILNTDLGVVRPDGRTIADRWLGGWGVCSDRNCKDCTFDVHAAVVHVLCNVLLNYK